MLMLPGILLEWFSMSFLMVPSAPITTGTVVVLSPPRSLNFDFQYLVSVTVVFFYWGVGVEGYSHVNEKAGFILVL